MRAECELTYAGHLIVCQNRSSRTYALIGSLSVSAVVLTDTRILALINICTSAQTVMQYGAVILY